MEVLRFNEKALATLVQGKLVDGELQQDLVPRLFDALAEEADRGKAMAQRTGATWEGRLALAFDRGVTFDTVTSVLVTAGRAGYSDFRLLVSPPGAAAHGVASIAVQPPRFRTGGSTPASMTIEMSPGAFSLSTGRAAEVPPTSGSSTADAAAIESYASDLLKREPGLDRLVFSATPEPPFAEIAAVVSLAKGSCTTPSPACRAQSF